MNNTFTIGFDSWAKEWNEALPIGNGRMGAMVYGTIATEVLQLNNDSVWFGGTRDRINPSALTYLPKIREAINEGNISEAEDMASFALTGLPDTQGHYEPLANLYILQDHDESLVSDYKRELDISKSLVTTSYRYDGVLYSREVIASYPDQVIAIRLTSDRNGSINLHTSLARGNITWDFSSYKRQTYRNPGYNDYAESVKNIGVDKTLLKGSTSGTSPIGFACAVKVVNIGGSLESVGSSLIVREADEVVILIASNTSFYSNDYVDEVLSRLDRIEKDWNGLYREHYEDYSSLYNRMELTLPETEWEIVRMFNYGRYLMISGSRQGSQPLNLQGIWNKDMNPMWGSKYTININTQMNYWPCEICNLSECHEPLFDLIRRMYPRGREVASRMYGCNGFVAHHNTDLWGDCAPQDACLSSSYWIMGAAWLSLHIWKHYSYTNDLDFLAKNYEIIGEASIFLLDFYQEDGCNIVTNPSISPENEYFLPNGNRGVLCKGPTMDNQIALELWRANIKAADILGVENAVIDEINKAIEKLVPMKINSHGAIDEWNEGYEEVDPGHRHISHLFGLFPGHSITRDNEELFEAAKTTLDRRISNGGGHTGWSRAWIINLYANLFDGDKAYDNIKELIRNSLLPNLLDNHPPFQIDGNFGLVSGIMEMLVQSREEEDILLPALPKAWSKGSLKGARLLKNRTVDISWENGKIRTKSIY